MDMNPLIPDDASSGKGEDGQRGRLMYPNELTVYNMIPVGRALTLLFALVTFVGGVRFILGLCTYGMKVVFSTSLAAYSMFTVISIFAAKPYPLTYTFAKMHGLHAVFCSLFCFYHGMLVALVATLISFSTIINFVPLQDFMNWSCTPDDDNASSGRFWGG